MIIFERIRWKNFIATGNVWTEVELNKYPTTLILGANGHGKSTLLDALCFVLFGKPFRNINKPNLVNSINRKDCLVELEFKIGPKQFKIRRGIAPAIFEVIIDGVPQDQDAVTGDYQKYLEDSILKFTHKAFTQIGILGSKSFVPFMKLKTSERRLIIDNLLDIEILSAMSKIAKDTFKTYVESVGTNKTNIDNTQSKIKLHQAYMEDAKKNTKDQIDTRLALIESTLVEIERLSKEEANKIARRDRLKELLEWRKTFETKLQESESRQSAIKRDIEMADEEHQFYNSHDNCPTCKQTINNSFKESMQLDAITRANEARKNHANEIEKAFKWYDGIKQADKYLIEYNDVISRINLIQSTISVENGTIKRLNREIEELGKKATLSDEMMNISRELVSDLEKYMEERKELLENRAYYEAAVNLLKDGGIKTQIIKQYLPVINSLVNKYLAAMDFYVAFELNEEFEETIKSRHRDAFTYDSFSEGEKQKIDIALLFAWRAVAKLKNSMNTNLLIMDEIFDSSLDGTGVDLVLSILSTMPEGTNIFVISHRELLHDKFSNTLRFQKKNNFSEIVEQEI